MPPKPRAKGLFGQRKRQIAGKNYRKKKRPVGNKQIVRLKQTKMGRIGLDAALALKTLKKHEPPLTHTNLWSPGVDRCLVVLPYALDRSATNSETQRECDNIYYFNARGEFEIKPLATNCESYYLRFIMGWSKGNPDGAHPITPAAGAHTSTLHSLLGTLESKLDNDHYQVIVDREYTHSPSQIYNASVASTATAGQQSYTSKANWKPFIKKFNFKFNKKVRYDGPSGADAVGDIPFIAMLIYQDQHAAHAYTGHNAPFPSPDVKVLEKAYFKDC